MCSSLTICGFILMLLCLSSGSDSEISVRSEYSEVEIEEKKSKPRRKNR